MAKITSNDKIVKVVHEARESEDLDVAAKLLSNALAGKVSVEAHILLLLERSACLEMLGDAEPAMDDCDMVLELAKQNNYQGGKTISLGNIVFDPVKEAHSALCWALIDLADYPMALNACNAALHIKGDDHWMLFARGLIRLYLGDSEADQDFDKARKISLDTDGQCYASCLEALNKIKANRQIEVWGKTILDTVIKSTLKLG